MNTLDIVSLYIVSGMALVIHFGRRVFSWLLGGTLTQILALLNIGSLLGGLALYVLSIILKRRTVTFAEFVAVDWLFSVLLYTSLCEALLFGLKGVLTNWRGEHWTKELDYPYLALAGLGVFLAIGRTSVLSDKVSLPDSVGPIAISIAIVLRTIKTRAEINGWNKSVKPGAS
jgi:hypothetical protein